LSCSKDRRTIIVADATPRPAKSQFTRRLHHPSRDTYVQVHRRLILPILAASLVAACGGGDKKADSALAADSSLNKDLALAGADSTKQPALADVPATPTTKTPATKTSTATKTKTPTTKAPAPTKTAPARATSGTIEAGTQLAVRANADLCTNTHKIGDKFMATVNNAVVGSNGATIPAGAVVTLTVTKLNRSNNVNDPIEMQFSVDQVEFGGKTYAINGSVSGMDVQRVRSTSKSSDVKKVVGGAAIGAIAGQVIGKSTKATVIGAAVGGAAGAGAAAATANYEGCVRAGNNFVVTLGNALTLPV